jgi:hypothetical protein
MYVYIYIYIYIYIHTYMHIYIYWHVKVVRRIQNLFGLVTMAENMCTVAIALHVTRTQTRVSQKRPSLQPSLVDGSHLSLWRGSREVLSGPRGRNSASLDTSRLRDVGVVPCGKGNTKSDESNSLVTSDE